MENTLSFGFVCCPSIEKHMPFIYCYKQFLKHYIWRASFKTTIF